jgi:hypothetical protein
LVPVSVSGGGASAFAGGAAIWLSFNKTHLHGSLLIVADFFDQNIRNLYT